MTRRGFLAGAMGTIAFRDTAWAALELLSPASAGPEDEKFWTEVRSHFTFHERLTSFNHVGLAPTPKEVVAEVERQQRRAAALPTQVLYREQLYEIDEVRNRLAKLVGAKPSETALTYNASYGLQTGIMGWPLEKGDAIATSTHDYSRAFTAIRQRCRREGMTLVEVPVTSPPASKKAIIESWSAALKPPVKLAVMCTVTFLNGQIVPVPEIIELCRSRGIAVLLDGAQSIGLLPTTFGDWQAEMYTACLHKWLMAPIATGVFAVRESSIRKVWSLSPSEESLERDIKKFEQVGTRPLAPILAIHKALDFHEWLGMDLKFKRIEYLRMRILRAFAENPDLVLYSNPDSSSNCAMITVGLRKKGAAEVASSLATEYAIHVTTALRGGVDAIRISPNVFTSPAEIDRLVSAVKELAAS